jgi:hypothetical protein
MKQYLKKERFQYRIHIRSRHPSHSGLRKLDCLPKLPFRSIVRFGSQTLIEDNKKRISLNDPEAISNSCNKLKMKKCFDTLKVKTAMWWTYNMSNRTFNLRGTESDVKDEYQLPYPIISKHVFGSRGKGNTKIDNPKDMIEWLSRHNNTSSYIFEVYHSFSREYRLHVNKNGCFYTCRKMLKSDTPEEKRWFRNDSNSVWILEDNINFQKPINWNEIIEHSVNALKSVGLDFGAVDLKVQGETNNGKQRETCDFIVIEINSAPSFGDVTLEKYKIEIPKMLIEKHNLQLTD